jgi:formiminoglutamase
LALEQILVDQSSFSLGFSFKNIAIQHNRFCKGSQIIVLGQINVTEEMIAVKNLNFNDKDRSKLSH